MEKIKNAAQQLNEKRLLFLLLSVTFVIRVGTIFCFKTFIPPHVGSEMGWIAYNIATGEGFKLGDSYTAWMAPVYPYMLAMIYRSFDYASIESTIAILVLQSFISALVIIPLYLVGKQIFNWRVGFLGAVLWSIHPASIQVATSTIWSTNLTALGMILIVALFLQLRAHPNHLAFALVLGLVIGLTALSDPVILVTIPFLSLWLIWRAETNRTQMAKQVVVVAVVAMLTILPWTTRNYFVFDQFVPIKGNMGINLWLGNHNANVNQPTAGMGFWHKLEAEYSEQDVRFLASLSEVELDKIMLGRAAGFISANPAIFARYSLHRVYLFWRMTVAGNATPLDRALMLLPMITLLGIFLSKHYWRDTSLLLFVFASYPLIYYVTHFDIARYRFPIEGLMLLFVASLLHAFVKAGIEFAR